MSFFALIFLSFLTNQMEKNETLETSFEIFKKLRACLVSISEYCFLFLRTKNTQKQIWWFWRTISSCFSCFLHYERKKTKAQKNHGEQKKNTRGEQKDHS